MNATVILPVRYRLGDGGSRAKQQWICACPWILRTAQNEKLKISDPLV